MRSRVELFEQIRKDHRDQELSIRQLAEKYQVHRRTIRQALENAIPPARKPYSRRAGPAIDEWTPVIDAWLLADRQAPRKQRHTARRIWQRLIAEHGASLAEVTVSRYVARRKAELGFTNVEVAIPQTHLPGCEAEVDFGEFEAIIAGRASLGRREHIHKLSNGGRFVRHSSFPTCTHRHRNVLVSPVAELMTIMVSLWVQASRLSTAPAWPSSARWP